MLKTRLLLLSFVLYIHFNNSETIHSNFDLYFIMPLTPTTPRGIPYRCLRGNGVETHLHNYKKNEK